MLEKIKEAIASRTKVAAEYTVEKHKVAIATVISLVIADFCLTALKGSKN